MLSMQAVCVQNTVPFWHALELKGGVWVRGFESLSAYFVYCQLVTVFEVPA